MSDSKSILEFLGPKKSFIFGFIIAVILMVIIGLVMQLSSGNSLFAKKDKVVTFGNQADKVTDTTGTGTTDTADVAKIKLADITSADHIRGDLSTAEVVLVEFSDYDCSFCSRFHVTMEDVFSQYGGKVAWVYRHFPLDSLHPEARAKAEASECINELGGNEAFWKFTDIMFDDTRSIKVADFGSVVTEVGVSVSDFNNCVDSGRYADKVESQYQDAITSGGRGTPHSIIVTRDGQQVPLSGAVPIDQVILALDSVL